MTDRFYGLLGVIRGRGRREEEELRRRMEEESRAKASEARRERTLVLKQVKDDLWRAFKNKDNEHLMFICDADLEQLWNMARIEQLSTGLEWSRTELLRRAQKKFRKVMSTLVWIDWDCWTEFGRQFLEHLDDNGHLDRSDKDLPLENTSFLDSEQHQTFFRNYQYIFIPVTLLEDNEEDLDGDDMQYSEKYRMPFIETKVIGQGGSGTVTKEKIVAGQFGYKHGAYNRTPLLVARKCIKRARTPGSGFDESFSAERKNLKSFKRCLEGNRNIMLSYTSFAHGPNFNIISPLADLDLHTFFEGTYHDFPIRCRDFTPAHLLYGASCLAGALSFLHEGLQPVGIAGKMYCAHLDLKPENILVVWKGSNEPAGRWLVHDFGTSKIKEKSSVSTLAPGDFLRQFSLTQPQRAPGPFQAPEVQRSNERVVGTESDIWSLGCILAVVLAFALGGPSYVTALAHSRAREVFVDDYFYIRKDNKLTLKEEVVKWLDDLYTGTREYTWVKDTLSLVYKTLVEKPAARPTAKTIKDALGTIFTKTGIGSLQNKCGWAPTELPCVSPATPPTSTVPILGPEEPRREISTTIERPIRDEPGLEVVPSQLSSPRTGSMSRSSSTSTRPVSITDDTTYMKFEVPKNTFKAVICPSACHAIFISRNKATIVRLGHIGNWKNKSDLRVIRDDNSTRSIDCPNGFKWDRGCSSGQYLLLITKTSNHGEGKMFLYHCDTSEQIWAEVSLNLPHSFLQTKISDALDIHVSNSGGIILNFGAHLWFYSQQFGAVQLSIQGLLRTNSSCFSPDGRRVFAWSHEQSQMKNHFYKWDTSILIPSSNANQTMTLVRKWHKSADQEPTPRPGGGQISIFPFLEYFVAFDRPDRIYTIGKDAYNPTVVKFPREVRDIIAGASIQGKRGHRNVESLILLQNNGKGLLMTLSMVLDGANSLSEGSKLENQFLLDKSALSILDTGQVFYVVVAHIDGKLERRKISST